MVFESGKGCNVLENRRDVDACKRITGGAHSYRTWDDVDFGHLFRQCGRDAETDDEEIDCKVTVRRGFRWVESNRFAPMLEKSFRFFINLDSDEMESFTRKHPRLVKRLREYAYVEGWNKFRDQEAVHNILEEKLNPKHH